jgi:hypothetical protein
MDPEQSRPTLTTNAEDLEGRLKEGSLARRLVSAYRAHTDQATRLTAIRTVVEQRLSELRGK